MKPAKTRSPFKLNAATRRVASAALVFAVLTSLTLGTLAPVIADTRSKTAKGLTEDQKIIHVLNRLGFGPRPGDVARVQSMGIRQYIEQQLRPELMTTC